MWWTTGPTSSTRKDSWFSIWEMWRRRSYWRTRSMLSWEKSSIFCCNNVQLLKLKRTENSHRWWSKNQKQELSIQLKSNQMIKTIEGTCLRVFILQSATITETSWKWQANSTWFTDCGRNHPTRMRSPTSSTCWWIRRKENWANRRWGLKNSRLREWALI